MILPRRRYSFLRWTLVTAFILLSYIAFIAASSSSAGTGRGTILRVRLQDGTVERLQVPEGAQDKLSLKEALRAVAPDLDGIKIQLSNKMIEDPSQTIDQLGLQHGSLLSLVSATAKPASLTQKKTSTISKQKSSNRRWDPFPDLAKDYQSAVRKSKTRRSGAGTLSYADLAHIQSELHVVEPQPKGPLLRLYMCPTAAERFQAAGIQTTRKKQQQTAPQIVSRAGLLLGNFARERVDLKAPKRPRTSLSSQPKEEDYCNVAKVHAIWEAPSLPSSSSSSTTKNSHLHYDASGLFGFAANDDDATQSTTINAAAKAVKIASWLGLEIVGWIFTYQGQRHSDDDDNLPVFCRDVQTGAKLQIENMKAKGREDGARFVTLAMDAASGATETFQLSDVSVQMVAEDMIVLQEDEKTDSSTKKEKSSSKKKKKQNVDSSGRFGKTRHSILVDGKETKELDSVLCLVNTAMLSKKGTMAGRTSTTKKNGSLTNKARKTLLELLDKNNDSDLLEELCNFHTLLAFHDGLGEVDCQRLCELVRKWARGQKKGTVMDDKLKQKLRSILDH